jgi:hypothetical protein
VVLLRQPLDEQLLDLPLLILVAGEHDDRAQSHACLVVEASGRVQPAEEPAKIEIGIEIVSGDQISVPEILDEDEIWVEGRGEEGPSEESLYADDGSEIKPDSDEGVDRLEGVLMDGCEEREGVIGEEQTDGR